MQSLRNSIGSEIEALTNLVAQSRQVTILQQDPDKLLNLVKDLKSLENRLGPLYGDYAELLNQSQAYEESAHVSSQWSEQLAIINNAKNNFNFTLTKLRMRSVSQIDTVSETSEVSSSFHVDRLYNEPPSAEEMDNEAQPFLGFSPAAGAVALVHNQTAYSQNGNHSSMVDVQHNHPHYHPRYNGSPSVNNTCHDPYQNVPHHNWFLMH